MFIEKLYQRKYFCFRQVFVSPISLITFSELIIGNDAEYIRGENESPVVVIDRYLDGPHC